MTENLYGLAKDIEERAIDEITSILSDIAHRLVDNKGRAPGDVEYEDIDVVEQMMELERNGTMPQLMTVNQKLALRMRKEFDEAMLRLTDGGN